MPTPTNLIEWLAMTRARLVEKGWTPGMPNGAARCLYMTMEAVLERKVNKRGEVVDGFVGDENNKFWMCFAPKARVELLKTIGIVDRRMGAYAEWDSLVRWNDRQTSVEPVLCVLDQTITRLQCEAS